MPRRVLITGVDGFTGRHLARALGDDPECVVLGTGRRDTSATLLCGYRRCDMTDAASVCELIAWARPEIVYHLAGVWGDTAAAELENVNIGGFERLRGPLRALAGAQPVRLLVIGSAAEIGSVTSEQLPVNEATACRPTTAYGASKHALVQAALAEPIGSGLEVVVARPFNLLGAGLSCRLAPGAFAAAVRAVASGETDTIRCGWLDGRRDYLDIGDAVRAYRLLVEQAPAGTLAQVCSGRSLSLRAILMRFLALAGIDPPVVAAVAPRAGDVADIHGSHARLSALTGWQPQIEIDASLAALLGEVGH